MPILLCRRCGSQPEVLKIYYNRNVREKSKAAQLRCISCKREWIQAIPDEWNDADVLEYARKEFEHEKAKRTFESTQRVPTAMELAFAKARAKAEEKKKK